MMNAMEWRERETGALVGLAVGDALAAPLEVSAPAEARRRCEVGAGDNVAVGVAHDRGLGRTRNRRTAA
jgi:ADP-ribosylglycohydrolase